MDVQIYDDAVDQRQGSRAVPRKGQETLGRLEVDRCLGPQNFAKLERDLGAGQGEVADGGSDSFLVALVGRSGGLGACFDCRDDAERRGEYRVAGVGVRWLDVAFAILVHHPVSGEDTAAVCLGILSPALVDDDFGLVRTPARGVTVLSVTELSFVRFNLVTHGLDLRIELGVFCGGGSSCRLRVRRVGDGSIDPKNIQDVCVGHGHAVDVRLSISLFWGFLNEKRWYRPLVAMGWVVAVKGLPDSEPETGIGAGSIRGAVGSWHGQAVHKVAVDHVPNLEGKLEKGKSCLGLARLADWLGVVWEEQKRSEALGVVDLWCRRIGVRDLFFA